MINSISTSENVQSINSVNSAEPNRHEENAAKTALANRDEYVPSENREPIGLYSVEPDENGEPRISFDKGNEPVEQTTANTDNVDREIKGLREKAQSLQQKLRSADENSAADIQRQLEQVTAELAQKDNDQYRRQNAVFT